MTTAGVNSLSFQNSFVDHVTVDQDLSYFSQVYASKFEFTEAVLDIEYFVVALKISKYSNDDHAGTIIVFFKETTNEIAKVGLMTSNQLKPD